MIKINNQPEESDSQRLVCENAQKILYLQTLSDAIDSGNYKIVGNRISFYLKRDCDNCTHNKECPDSDGLPLCIAEGAYTRSDAKLRKENKQND